MAADLPTLQARLAAWHAQGASRIDPLRFGLMRALATRAQQQHGLVRHRLEARLAQLADAYAVVVEQQAPASVPGDAASNPLQQLLARLNATPLQYALPLAASASAGAEVPAEADIAEPSLLPALDEFQQLWGRIRIESLLRQCLDSLPADAGPLHSSVLTYRAMALMQEVSPDYLQHFIAYVDVLTWMEQLGGASGGNAEGTRAAVKRKGTPRRKKPAAS